MPILDSSSLAGGELLPDRLLCDVCIIGTGPAGVTIARELSGTPLRVTILESGGAERQEAADALNEVENVGWPRVADQWLVRNRVVGGSSSTWTGRCAPFDDIDLQAREWVPYSGWPFGMDDLIAYLDRSAKYLGLGVGSGFTDDRVRVISGHKRPVSGPDPSKLLPMFWQYSRDFVNTYDKVRFGRNLSAELGRNVTLVTKATVLRINANDQGDGVRSVDFVAADGRRWTLPVSTVVVCAGAIENAHLLLSSDNVVARGLGNGHDLVRPVPDGSPARHGRQVPHGPGQAGTARVRHVPVPGCRRHLYQHGLRLSPAVQRSEQLLNCAIWIGEHSGPDDPWDALTRFLRGQATVGQDLRTLLANSGLLLYGVKEHYVSHRGLPRKLHAVTLDAMCEQRPDPDSRLTLSDRRDRLGMRIPRIDWRVSPDEARTMRRITELTVEQLYRMGLATPALEDWVRDGGMIPETIMDAAHPTGTTRMADDPARGVVDAHCQVHGVHGLFVAGSSVFPTSSHANPTQMIVALALRLADTLKDRVAAVARLRAEPVADRPDSALVPAETASGNARTRVLVTGATGSIGRHVVSELLVRGYSVRAVTSTSVSGAPARDRLEWRQLDFQQSLNFDPLVRDCAAVVHLAAELAVPERMQRSNAAATRALAEASERAGVRVFCYTSSVSVYGSSRRRQVREDSPVLTADRDVPGEYWVEEALRCYGRTKLQGEQAIRAVARDVEYVILRPTAVVDIPDLVEMGGWSRARKMRAGSRHAHHVYVRDVADATAWFLERALRRDEPSPGVAAFNLSDDDAPVRTYSQIFKLAHAASGDRRWRAPAIPWPVEWLWAVVKFRTFPVRQSFGRMLYSGEKLHAEGYNFRFGMARAIAAFQAELRPTSGQVTDVRPTGEANSGTPAHGALAGAP